MKLQIPKNEWLPQWLETKEIKYRPRIKKLIVVVQRSPEENLKLFTQELMLGNKKINALERKFQAALKKLRKEYTIRQIITRLKLPKRWTPGK